MPQAQGIRGGRQALLDNVSVATAVAAPVPPPVLEPGQRAFRSHRQGFQLFVSDVRRKEVDGEIVDVGERKIARFLPHAGGAFGQFVTSDPEIIAAIEKLPGYGTDFWDARDEQHAYHEAESQRIANLLDDPEVLRRVAASLREEQTLVRD